MTKSRLEAFTDAIIAIIMTVLVLTLKAPKDDTFISLWDIRYKLLFYIVSFVTLAIYWHNHHHLLQIAKKINGQVMWVNTFFIFTLTFFPLSTEWVGEHLFSVAPEVSYGVVILMADVSYGLLAHTLVKVNGEQSDIAKVLNHYTKIKLSIGLNLLAIILAFWQPIIVPISAIIVLLLWIIPEKRIEKYFAE